MNGKPYTPGTELQLTPSGNPVVIVMAFPFAVDRTALERWLPRTATVAWTDDKTVQLTYPETETNTGFKIPEVRAADGSAVMGLFVVSVAFPATRVINLFTIAELTSSNRVPSAATSFRITAPSGLTVSPDGRRAISYDGIGLPSGSVPALIDLATRTRTPLVQPTAADGPFALADWLPDGQLIVVGKDIWIGDADARTMRKVTDAATAAGSQPSAAVLSVSGDRLAIWGDNADGHVALVDLKDGAVTRITGPFRRSGAGARVSFAWSSDGGLLAGTDSDPGGGAANARVRIVDVATDRTVRTIEGSVLHVSSFPTGELMVIRDAGEQGAAARNLGLVMGFDGSEHRRFFGCSWAMSPDARYILQAECGGAGYAGHTLIDVSTGSSWFFGTTSAFGRWLPDLRLAFY